MKHCDERAMIRPVILCGGAGTRLWPVSRQLFPKQLFSLFGGKSLLQETVTRLAGEQFAAPVIVSGEDQHIFIKRQLDETGTSPEAILLEPTGRNTAAAAALAAGWLNAAGHDDLLLLMPSDHVIMNADAFLRAISIAADHARSGAIVTFGAQPTEPNTQYGYIEAQDDGQSRDGALPIARFVEKPNAEKAAEYFATGRFYWNAGIFLVSQRTLLEEMRQFLPDSLNAIREAVANGTTDGVFVRPEATAFKRAENISIDHAIMEKTQRGIVVPVQMDWSDVGSWDAVWKLAEKDVNENVLQGDVVSLDTRGSLLRSESGGPMIAAVGLDRTAVIASSDAVFIAPLDRASDAKQMVETLRSKGRNSVVQGAQSVIPSGSCELLVGRPEFQVKHIVIPAGERVLLEPHAQSKHWVVVHGTAEVSIGEMIRTIGENEGTYIPAATRHSLINRQEAPLQVVEILCAPPAADGKD